MNKMCFESLLRNQDPVVCRSIRETVSPSDASCEKRTVAENCGKCEMCWDRSRVRQLCILGVARFFDASIYRDTFPAIRIAILLFTIAIFFFFFPTIIFI